MADAEAPAAGRFVWHDLVTNDPDTAREFYSDLFGWTYREQDMGEFGTYNMIHLRDCGIGGVVKLDPAQAVPSHWLSYVTVPDVDGAAKRIAEAGGNVAVPPTDIPNVGRFCVAMDPGGACFSPFKFEEEPPEMQDRPVEGMFCWNEVLPKDTRSAESFYTKVLGWGNEKVDMGEAGVYTLFKRAGKDAAGMLQRPAEAPGPDAWLLYVAVDDCDASAAKATKLGAKQWVAPRDIPGIGRFAVLSDPTGATFAIYQSARG